MDNNPAFELCKQLHQQYAEADNNKTHNLFGFIGSIAFLFTGYGFAYKLYCENENKYQCVFLSIAIIVVVLLILVFFIGLNYGYTQRRDQIIIQRIRKQYFQPTDYNDIFGVLYNSENKNLISFIPDYYLSIAITAYIFQIVVVYFTTHSLDNSICCILKCLSANSIILLITIIQLWIILHYFYKYNKATSEGKIIIKVENACFLFDFKAFPQSGYFEVSKDKITNQIQIKIRNHEKGSNSNVVPPEFHGNSNSGADGEQ